MKKLPVSELNKATRKLCKQLSFDAVSKTTGLPVAWVAGFALGAIKSPGVDRVVYLYEALSGRKIGL